MEGLLLTGPTPFSFCLHTLLLTEHEKDQLLIEQQEVKEKIILYTVSSFGKVTLSKFNVAYL